MPYSLEVTDAFQEAVRKTVRKNKSAEEIIKKKINRILQDPRAFKPLRAPLQNKRSVHVLGSFIMVYEIIEERKAVVFLKFAHHDEAYKH
jgi:YafQ family addiction module toxin component